MKNKLYVGGISYSSTSEDLKKYFSEAGEVKDSMIIMDKFTNRSKGFGFVEMMDDATAQKAIEMFNDKEFMGRKLLVNIAQPKEDKPRSSFRPSNGGGRSGGYSSGGNGGGYRSGGNDRPRRSF